MLFLYFVFHFQKSINNFLILFIYLANTDKQFYLKK